MKIIKWNIVVIFGLIIVAMFGLIILIALFILSVNEPIPKIAPIILVIGFVIFIAKGVYDDRFTRKFYKGVSAIKKDVDIRIFPTLIEYALNHHDPFYGDYHFYVKLKKDKNKRAAEFLSVLKVNTIIINEVTLATLYRTNPSDRIAFNEAIQAKKYYECYCYILQKTELRDYVTVP